MAAHNRSSKAQAQTENSNENPLADLLKRVVTTGLGAASLTEEMAQQIFSNAKTTKDGVVDDLKKGIDRYLQQIDWQKCVETVLDKYDLEISGTVRFKKKAEPEETSDAHSDDSTKS